MNVNNPRQPKYGTYLTPDLIGNGILVELDKIQNDHNVWFGKISVSNDDRIFPFPRENMYDLRYTLEPSKSSF